MTTNPRYSHLSAVLLGHVDAGKSTMTGRLLFELGRIDIKDLEKLRKEAAELGKESFLFAFWMDKTKDERARGISMQCTTKEFFTTSYHYSIMDAPGHRDFVANVIPAICQVDVAILMVPASEQSWGNYGFKASIARPNQIEAYEGYEPEGQSRHHARLCYALGIEQLIVCINKMDDRSVNYSEFSYNQIRHQIETMLAKIGYEVSRIPIIPMSAFKGDNLTEKSENMKWCRGYTVKLSQDRANALLYGYIAENIKRSFISTIPQDILQLIMGYISRSGDTLIDALENSIYAPKRAHSKPFRMTISKIYNIKGVGVVVAGRVVQGRIKPGAKVKFCPSGCNGIAVSIEMYHKSMDEASAGDMVGIHIKDFSSRPDVGDVMYIDDIKIDPSPPRCVKEFTALVNVDCIPSNGKLFRRLRKNVTKAGYTPSIHIGTARAPCKMIGINWKIGKSTSYEMVENDIEYVEEGDQAEIVFTTSIKQRSPNPFVVIPFDECETLGRFVAMDQNNMCMFGKVLKVDYC